VGQAQAPVAAEEQNSEQPGAPLTLTLEDVLARVVGGNWDIRLADLAAAEAEAALGEAKAPDRLQVSLESSYSRLGPEATMSIAVGDGDPQSITIGPDESYSYGISLYKSLYSSGRNEALQALAKLNIDVKDLEAAIARRQVSLAATTVFYAITRAMGFVQVASETSEAAREHWRIAAARYQAGAVPKFDLMRAEVDVANAEQDLIVANTAVETAQAALKTLLGIDVTQPIEVATTPDPSPMQIDPKLSIDLARQRREEMAVARKHKDQAITAMRLARAERGANLDFVGGYDQQSSSGFSGDYSWNLTLSLSKPLSDGGASRSKQLQALRQAEQAEALLGKTQDQIAQEVWNAYLNLEQAKSRLGSTAKTVELAQEALRISEVRYESGLATPVEVSDARVALTAARTNHVDAIYGYQVAEVELLSAVNVSPEELKGLEPRSEAQ